MSKITLNSIASLDTILAATTINNNMTTIQTAFDNTLSRDGTTPNTMGANLDMNSFRILNLPAPASALDPVRVQDLSSYVVTTANQITVPNSTTVGSVAFFNATNGQTLGTDPNFIWDSVNDRLQIGTVAAAGNNVIQIGIGSATGRYLDVKNSVGEAQYGVDSAGQVYAWCVSGTATIFGTQGAVPVDFYTNNVRTLRLFVSGGMGIGTGAGDPGTNNLRVVGSVLQVNTTANAGLGSTLGNICSGGSAGGTFSMFSGASEIGRFQGTTDFFVLYNSAQSMHVATTGGTYNCTFFNSGGTFFGNNGAPTADPGANRILLNPTTVASLPAASSTLKGAMACVSDGTGALAWGATVTGGASTPYLVFCNGTNWTVMGK